MLGAAHRRVVLSLCRLARPEWYRLQCMTRNAVMRVEREVPRDESLVRSVAETASRIDGRLSALSALVSRLSMVRGEGVCSFALSDQEADALIVSANVAGGAMNDRATAPERRAMIEVFQQLDALPQERVCSWCGPERAA